MTKIDYTIVSKRDEPLSDVVIKHEANASRMISHVRVLVNGFASKSNLPSKEFLDLRESLHDVGFDEAVAGCLVLTEPLNDAERDGFAADLARFRKELGELVLSKKGYLAVDIGQDKPGQLKTEHLQAAFDVIWGKPKKDGTIKVSKTARIPVSGNTRTVGLVFEIAVCMLMGISYKHLLKVPAQTRLYPNALNRAKDCVHLNEVGKMGKTETSLKEKVVAAISMGRIGFKEADLKPIFVKRGVVQQLGEFVKNLRYIRWAGFETEADEIEGFLVNPEKTVPSQEHLKGLRPLRIACEHSDGNKDNKTSFLGKGTRSDPIRVQENVEANPDLVQGLLDYYAGIMAGKTIERVRGMSRNDIRSLAADMKKASPEAFALLLAVGDNDSVAAKAAAEKIAKLYPPVRVWNDERKPDGKPLSQKAFNVFQTNGMKARPKPKPKAKKKTG